MYGWALILGHGETPQEVTSELKVVNRRIYFLPAYLITTIDTVHLSRLLMNMISFQYRVALPSSFICETGAGQTGGELATPLHHASYPPDSRNGHHDYRARRPSPESEYCTVGEDCTLLPVTPNLFRCLVIAFRFKLKLECIHNCCPAS